MKSPHQRSDVSCELCPRILVVALLKKKKRIKTQPVIVVCDTRGGGVEVVSSEHEEYQAGGYVQTERFLQGLSLEALFLQNILLGA